MHSSTSTSTFRPVHRRQRSTNRPTASSPWEAETRQHANAASRPFPFVPRRVSSGARGRCNESDLPADVSVTFPRPAHLRDESKGMYLERPSISPEVVCEVSSATPPNDFVIPPCGKAGLAQMSQPCSTTLTPLETGMSAAPLRRINSDTKEFSLVQLNDDSKVMLYSAPWEADVTSPRNHADAPSGPLQFTTPRRRLNSGAKQLASLQLHDENTLLESSPLTFPHAEVASPLSPTVSSPSTTDDTRTHQLYQPSVVDSSATFPRVKAEFAHAPLPTFGHLVRKKSGELLKPSLRARTKSAPSTPGPSPKAVHFDQKLEHVRLFRARQTPRAISRDGSPTETSEGETSDGFPFPATLRLLSGTLTPLPADGSWTFDVRLERLVLDSGRSALLGAVLVRNIAFAKRVAVRFTLDAWQTTSEVAARHVTSLRGGTFDRFEFRIRLADFRRGRVLLCIRYSVDGRELWDNNNGRNYQVEFERERARGRDGMADLRTRLEGVVRDAAPPPRKQHPRVWLGADTDEEEVPPPRIRPRSPSPPKDALRDSAAAPLSARYDFGKSLKRPAWTPPPAQAVPVPGSRSRAHAPSPGMPIYLDDTPRPALGSPRDAADFVAEHEAAPRHHARAEWGSYFDAAPAVRRTPVASILDDDASTPSITSASSSPSISPVSPTSALPTEESKHTPTTYHAFLNQFCFFRGPGEQGVAMTRRSHSTSSVEDYFSSSPPLGRMTSTLSVDFATTPAEFPPSPTLVAG